MRAHLCEEREELKGLNDRGCYVKIGTCVDGGGLDLDYATTREQLTIFNGRVVSRRDCTIISTKESSDEQ